MSSIVRVHKMLVRECAVALLVVLSMAASPAAQSNSSFKPERIHIENFGKISDNYYRGAQPNGSDYADLAGLGVRTIIDLTRDGRADEAVQAGSAGLKFYRIPLTTSDRPAENAIASFLELVNDPVNQPVYVHCQGGRHRTGAMTAVYRMTEDGWTADRAYAEMKQFNFEGFPGHPTLKSFVYDYYTRISRTRLAGNQPTVIPVSRVF